LVKENKMSINKTWNGVVYSIPNTRSESGWETTLSNYLQALADNAATTTFNKQAVRKATTTPVTVSASTDCTIIVDLTGPGASTVNLPAGADKQIFIIVDGKGDASTNNITIDANGSETIEGSLTKVIRLNRECLVLQYSSSAGDWKVIGGYVPNMVGGPASSTDNAIARFDGTTGKLVQNSDCTISDTGAVTLGPSTGSGLAHVVQSGASTNLELLGGGGSYSTRLKFNANGGNGMILIPSASSLLFRDNANTTTLGDLTTTGAWTLGPSASTATNCVVNGAASVTHGVVFPASQNAVANANTLDDYEEGTWTPNFLWGGAASGITYGNRVATYTKIGNRVFFHMFVDYGSRGSSTGNFTITGLPFTSVATASGGHSAVAIWFSNVSLTNYVITGYVGQSSTTIFLNASPINTSAGSTIAVSDTAFPSNNGGFMITGHYITA
jgi:hypothetical protein